MKNYIYCVWEISERLERQWVIHLGPVKRERHDHTLTQNPKTEFL